MQYIYIWSCAGPTLYKCCNGAHFKLQSHCCHFNKMFQNIWVLWKTVPAKMCFWLQSFPKKFSQSLTPLICEVKADLSTAVPCTPPPYTLYSLLTTVHKHWNTMHINAFKLFLPPVPLSSSFVNMKSTDFMQSYSHRLMESVLVREKAGNLSEPIINWSYDYELYCEWELYTDVWIKYVLLIFTAEIPAWVVMSQDNKFYNHCFQMEGKRAPLYSRATGSAAVGIKNL